MKLKTRQVILNVKIIIWNSYIHNYMIETAEINLTSNQQPGASKFEELIVTDSV